MLPAVARGHRGWFHPCARLSVRMSSTGIDRKGILAERVAVVTGSTSGIGFAIARRLAQDGAHVVISSRKQQNVDRAAAQLQREGLSVAGIVCHVGKAEDRERLVATVRGQALEHCGGIDFLVCCAGVNPLVGSTLGTSEQIWDKILNVNVKSPALLLSQLLPYMEKRKGAVTLVSSVAAYFPRMELGVYNVSKTALLALTRTLALELAPKDIRVNCLVPGVIKTDFSKVLHGNESLLKYLREYLQMQRIGEPEDCAGIVSFLCSPDASYITGENIAVAGFSSRL
ncbi:dehydrogenase/reductase SDR family member 2, mitochondrial isoform X2 [Macaca fascicularis]|uniref:dehydrogenase/reductase SDR family member 2, mitochondrial isoform X2 n=1 Tax=Macaca fascicularis TaxID=9541 RepID=UPI0003AB4E7E|nr:dehydrogenase/reductase SDR family member 2, mitochondrial isoform X1 [Macaca fascicularis]XP_045252161.1 dehydrogenase/reductase SDR family member 2, mitochondrial isoform X1 [Macaca fascicularis]XP_045252162.1 dehydrogenase/reductase SDR family member 2, mitochondrial isoform X1 [Macaca fascicularis]